MVRASDLKVAIVCAAVGFASIEGVAYAQSTCKNGVLEPPEQCDDGAANGTPQSCCASDCRWVSANTPCGDTSKNDCTAEDTCDGMGSCQPNDAPDGTACTDNGVFCDGAEACQAGECVGDGDPCDLAETCDETIGMCLPRCGNGMVESGEQCDDKNIAAGDGCHVCTIETGWVCGADQPDSASVCYNTCGNGMPDVHEKCDDGNVSPNDGCGPTCARETGWLCSPPSDKPSSCGTDCGDGIVLGNEACDDGNIAVSDGCTACTVDDGWACDSQQPTLCVVDNVTTGCECALGSHRSSHAPWLALVAFALLVLRLERCFRRVS